MNIQKQITQRRSQQAASWKVFEAKRKKAERERQARMALVAQTTDGLNPNMRAKLHQAARHAQEDPRAQAMVERAEVEKRVRDARREAGIGQAVKPVFMGTPLEPNQVPLSVAQRREAKREKEK